MRYPAYITNEEVYRRSEELPISQQIVEARWTFLGHLLRRERHRPANLVTAKYFISKEHHGQEARDASNRSRLLTTIPRILQKDLANMDLAECKDAFAITKLTATLLHPILPFLRNKAQNRGSWRLGAEKIFAASASGRRSRRNKDTSERLT